MPFSRPRRLDWERDGRTWPHREHSRFVVCGGIRWHVQSMGDAGAPVFLLLHGTGASSHSFRRLMPILAERYRVLTLDLPGHGFTEGAESRDLSLPGMAAALSALLRSRGIAPNAACGHSAGAAILIEMALSGAIAPAHLFGINAALKPIPGNAVLSPLAKLMFANPFVPRMFSFQAGLCDATGGLLRATGTELDAEDKRYYEILIRNPAHTAGALGMMANWDVTPIVNRLPQLATALTLIVAEDDKMVAPSSSRRAAERAPAAEIVSIPEGGHLLHEIAPERIAEIVFERVVPAESGKL